MKNITFKQEITVTEELVQGLALFLGYKPKHIRQIEIVDDATTKPPTIHLEDEEYANPQSPTEYVDELAKAHTASFFKPFAEHLVQTELEKLGIDEQKRQAQAQIEEQIVKPVEDALTSKVIVGDN